MNGQNIVSDNTVAFADIPDTALIFDDVLARIEDELDSIEESAPRQPSPLRPTR